MGIPGFYTWLKSRYKRCFIPISNKTVYDCIYIDVNFLLHTCISGARTEEGFKTRLYQLLDSILCNYVATKQITLAVDGTAPYAKVILSRGRRMAAATNCDPTQLSSLHLTTGTIFMSKVDGWIKDYANRITGMYKYTKVTVHVSATTEPGEGEIKLFKQLLLIGGAHTHLSHLVVGNDADLTVLAAAVKPVEKIYMLIRGPGGSEILSVQRLINRLTLDLNSIPLLTSNIWRTDFVLLSIMMSNDYIPKINYITYDMLWTVYKKTVGETNGGSLIDHTSETPKFCRGFMNSMAVNMVNGITNPGYRAFDPNTYDKNRVLCYLRALLWCLQMYQTAKCPMYDFTYNYSRSVSPADILFYVETYDVSNIPVPCSDTPAINHKVYPLMVMPKKAQCLVHPQFQKLMDGPLNYLYNSEGCVECTGLRLKLSTFHKQLIGVRKQLAGSPDRLKEDEIPIKKDIAVAQQRFMAHKRSHQGGFTSTDIDKIVSLTI